MSEIAQLAERLDRIPADVEAEIDRELKLLGLEVEAAAAAYLDSHGINFEGDTKNSIGSETRRVLAGLELSVYAASRHAAFVHNGTRPHWAPPMALAPWVRKKLGVTEPKMVRRVDYLVRRKIARVGTAPKPFLRDPAERLYAAFPARLGKVVGDRIRVTVAGGGSV